MYKENLLTNAQKMALALEKTELSCLHTLDSMIEGIAIITYDWKYLYANEPIAKQSHRTREEMIGKTVFEIMPAIESTIVFRECQKVMNNRIPQQFETEYKWSDGSVHWSLVKVAPIPEGIFIQSLDITEQQKSMIRERELRELNEFRTAELNAIIESIPDAVFVGNHEGLKICNLKALELLGADSPKNLEKGFGEIAKIFNIRRLDTGMPFNEDEMFFSRALKGETIEEDILATNIQTGRDVIIRVACAPVIQKEKVTAVVAIETDITQKKRVEHLIKSALREKEVLLRELYHRTKNNLQVISSLLSMKTSSINNKEAVGILNDMYNRIMIIARIHDMLHESTNRTRVNLSEYISDIIKLLKEGFLEQSKRITIRTELEEFSVHIDTAISCGLIVNELITNSLKYAFPENRGGDIQIKLSKEEEIIELNISDNGIGFKDTESIDGMIGLKIFHLIAEGQLEAKTNVQTKNGVKVNVRFTENKFEKETRTAEASRKRY